jgi:WD40 repeat protein
MTRVSLLSFAAALPCFALVSGAPVPKTSRTAITAENAHQLRPVTTVAKRAHRLVRAPKPGELVLLDWNDAAEVVDDAKLGKLRPLARDSRPIDIAVSPDGKLLAWTERGKKTYTVEDTDAGKTFDIALGDYPGFAAFSPDGKLLAIGDTFWDPNVRGAGHSEMKLFDVKGKLVRTLERSGPGALHPVFSPDGKTLAVGNRNHETRLFEVATGKLLHTLDRRMTQEVAFSPDGRTLAAGYVDGVVALWDVATGKLLHAAPSGCLEVYSVDWSPKGDVLVSSGRDGKIVLWEPGKFERLKELDAPSWVIQVRFTADGTRLLSSSAADHSGSTDRRITLWGVPDRVGR